MAGAPVGHQQQHGSELLRFDLVAVMMDDVTVERSGTRLMSDLYETLKQCLDRLHRFSHVGQRVNEQNTKAALIDPVLWALGWDQYDLDEVHREYRRRPTDNPVDYALLLMRTPKLFIEAKGLFENLDDPRWANQTISYATAAGVQWVALTNGAEWRIYNAHAPVPIEDKLFRSVRLHDDLDLAFEVLSLLSKDGMSDNRIEELWRGFFVDRQVHGALTDLFAGSDAELAELVAGRVARLGPREVQESLLRVRASFDFPSAAGASTDWTPAHSPPPAIAPEPPAPVIETAPATMATTGQHGAPEILRRTRNAVRKVTPEERRLKLRDLIAAGRLRPGDTLTSTYRQCGHTAEVLPDGRIRYQGRAYDSPSSAGEAVKIALYGPEVPKTTLATDGLAAWTVRDARAGDVVTLKDLRRRVAEGR